VGNEEVKILKTTVLVSSRWMEMSQNDQRTGTLMSRWVRHPSSSRMMIYSRYIFNYSNF